MRFKQVFICVILIYVKGTLSVCEEDDTPPGCSGFCFRAVKPCLSYLDALQNRVNAYEASVPSDILARESLIDSRLEVLGRQVAILQEKEEDSQKKITQLEDKLSKVGSSSLGDTGKFQKLGQKYYHIETESRENWHGALKKCHQMGGYLASPQGPHELEAIQGKLTKYTGYWIDITDQFSEGVYWSMSTGMRAYFLKWEENEPTQNGEKCVELHTFKETPSMNDNLCSRKKLFICESSGK
ncbi:hypothetical protein KR026_010734 [Drosophila bipectinata]|nr:hypothetical protein KR026_010734 [Drosophila bipectinata]